MLPQPDNLPGKGLVVDNFLIRNIIPFIIPNISDANFWRSVARAQPVFVDCLTTLTMYLQSLPWDIRPKDPSKQDKYEKEIAKYKKILKTANDGAGFLNYIELFVQDFYITNFGMGTELIKDESDDLFAIRRLDSATLYPNPDPASLFYVYQKVNMQTVMFTKDELIRSYLNARPEISRYAWGMGVPERIYFALELLGRGDKYYANLLLDTPEAGILDLGSMSKESATQWVSSFRNLMTGIDSFKVPVLYEHDGEAKYISFGKQPDNILFDSVTMKYAELVCAAFGLTTGDIGLKGGSKSGGALSAAMREERHSKATGFSSIRIIFADHINRFIPDYLEFKVVDTDDELLVSKGRARSANAIAGRNFAEGGIFSPAEWRRQMKADGLITIPLDDEQPDPDEFDIIKDISGLNEQLAIQKKQVNLQEKQLNQKGDETQFHKLGGQGGQGLNNQRNVRGGKLEQVQGKDNVPASQGGMGEIKRSATDESLVHFEQLITDDFQQIMNKLTPVKAKRLIRIAYNNIKNTLRTAILENNDYSEWRNNYISYLFGINSQFIEMPVITRAIDDTLNNVTDAIKKDEWWKTNLDDTEMGDFLIFSYVAGLKYAAEEIQRALYERDLVNSETVNLTFSLEDDKIKNELYNRAITLRTLIDDGTAFYINRLASASVVNVLDEFSKQFSENPEELIDNEVFLSRSAHELIDNFANILNDRIDVIAGLEIEKAYNSGILDQYKKVGLKTKALVHLGDDEPCEHCQKEEARGFIPINEMFKSKMGDDVQEPPLHSKCHHIVTFNRRELSGINTNYFTGKENK